MMMMMMQGDLCSSMYWLTADAPGKVWLSQLSCRYSFLQGSLSKLLLFERLDKASQAKVVEHTWTRRVSAGEILIQEGETGLAASELYVVKDGTFEVWEDDWLLCSTGTRHTGAMCSSCQSPTCLLVTLRAVYCKQSTDFHH